MTDYKFQMDEKFGFLSKIDVNRLVADCRDDWFNQTLCRVNDCVVRLGILKGEFHWHKHNEEDEMFFVLDGTLFVDVKDGQDFTLTANQGCAVPKGVVHRTRAPDGCVVLMFEGGGVIPAGD